MPTRRNHILLALLAVGLAHLLCAAPTAAQHTPARTDSASPSIQVLVLGTYHFAGSNADAVDSQVGDITSAVRQAQVQRVVDALVAFQPTKVAVEEARSSTAQFDSLFNAYRAGRHDLAPSEDQQPGFRVATRLDHDRVHAIDWRNAWPFEPVMEHAKKHQPSFVEYFNAWRQWFTTRIDSLKRHATVGQTLRWFNQPTILARIHAPNIRMLEVGTDSSFVGLEPTAKLYRRNLRIFANLTRIAEPGDRILVIYGASHATFFRDFIASHPQMTVVDPLDYL